METYYDPSLTASILLQEVMKELKIKFSPAECCKYGLDKKIFRRCKQVIEKLYVDKDYQELLKFYVSSYFLDDSVEEQAVIYQDVEKNFLESQYGNFFYIEKNLTN
ncbi:MAG: hypothetical protein CR986_06780 [Ignavibacteriae bacterium]|nr:MAG: hypothetical protein CR986_06780 [Ignavibacteriota bacterium]